MKLAVVIPAYNEAKTIADIVQRTLRYVELVVVVNDCSVDDTAAQLQGSAAIVLHNKQNQGKAATLLKGFKYVMSQGVEAIITLDGDGQHRPEDIPRLIEFAAADPSAIGIAARQKNRSAAPPMRRFANAFADFWISWASGYPIADSQSGFRLYPAVLFESGVEAFSSTQGFVLESKILIEAAKRRIFSHSLPVDTIYRENARPSHYRPLADTVRIVKMVAGQLLRRGMNPIGLLRALRWLPDPRG